VITAQHGFGRSILDKSTYDSGTDGQMDRRL